MYPRNHEVDIYIAIWCTILLLVIPYETVTGQKQGYNPLQKSKDSDFRVLSWNVSRPQFFEHAEKFQTIIDIINPDILLLDEIEGGRTPEEIRNVLPTLSLQEEDSKTPWNILVGKGGGYQRGSIISRYPVSPVPEFDYVAYTDSSIVKLRSMVPDSLWSRVESNLNDGMAVAGGIINIRDKKILAVSFDLQCCGNRYGWEEIRRQIEARRIHQLINSVLIKNKIDGIILAGDLNTVSSALPLSLVTNPYPPPHHSLVPVNPLHLDCQERWTWDGRGTPFPSNKLDFSLYSPGILIPVSSFILSTEDLPDQLLSRWNIEKSTSRVITDHLPIIVDYQWVEKTVVTDVKKLLSDYRHYFNEGNINRLINLYSDKSEFTWIENGEITYRSVEQVRSAITELFEMYPEAKITFGDTMITPLLSNHAVIVTNFNVNFSESTGQVFSYSGILTITAVKENTGWKFFKGHTSSKRE